MNAEWVLKALRRVAPKPKDDRVAYQSADTLNEQAGALMAQGKYAQALPFIKKVLEIHRRLLSDDHPRTATDYDNLAANLRYQGKYAAAQPLMEKALEIHRRLLSDEHFDTAMSYLIMRRPQEHPDFRQRCVARVFRCPWAKLRV